MSYGRRAPLTPGPLPSEQVMGARVARRSDEEIATAIRLAISDLNSTLEEARSAGLNFAPQIEPQTGFVRLHVWRPLI